MNTKSYIDSGRPGTEDGGRVSRGKSMEASPSPMTRTPTINRGRKWNAFSIARSEEPDNEIPREASDCPGRRNRPGGDLPSPGRSGLARDLERLRVPAPRADLPAPALHGRRSDDFLGAGDGCV